MLFADIAFVNAKPRKTNLSARALSPRAELSAAGCSQPRPMANEGIQRGVEAPEPRDSESRAPGLQ